LADSARGSLKIVFSGQVQGVGFRPTVKQLASRLGVTGWVRNAGGLAECLLSGDNASVSQLIEALRVRFTILRMDIEETAPFDGNGFQILESGGAPEGASRPALVQPDAPVCDDCLREMRDPANRRYNHPFISCSACGPRYSIMEALPYDRDTTSMRAFPMCPKCAAEYHSPGDRRLHAQTIACPDCGPRLYYLKDGAEQRDPIESAARDILQGGIVAVKGIGGYHLCCLPEDAPVGRLRALKGREQKPFAVMFRTTDDIEAVCEVSPEERALLESFARPIVLLSVKSPAFSDNVARGSLDYGCFLAYTPVHHLLLDATKAGGATALVMTSMNRSGSPILYEEERAIVFAPDEIAGVLSNDRPIVNPLDDSVALVICGAPQILRRARGYAPLPVLIGGSGRVFAAGGDLKAAFCLAERGYATVGPHIGDLEDEECLERFGMIADNLTALLDAHPETAACDMHPRYFSRAYAKGPGLPVAEAQHHHAHIASVMAEHGLARALGVAFDGTGYGTDQTVWGGEFLLCDGAAFTRVGHILPIQMPGGDESMRDAAKIAACYQAACDIAPQYRLWDVLEKALKLGINAAKSSSMGRLFDTASAILGICVENGYEGECAIKLERLAALARRAGIAPTKMGFDISEQDGRIVADWKPVIRALSEGGDVPAMALGFHVAAMDMVERVCVILCAKYQVRDVALSGGVFLNRILTEGCLSRLRAKGFNVYINRQVPPGDGGISLGQAFIISR
jgi:hydrogenase maturation protein HypF